MKGRIESRWADLEQNPNVPTFQLLDADHPLDIYVGKSVSGEPLYLIVDDEMPRGIRTMGGILVTVSKRHDDRWNLLLTLRDGRLLDVFTLLCNDLSTCAQHLRKGSPGMGFLVRRLRAWRKLLESGVDGLLNLSEVRGLFGELWMLERFVRSGIPAVDASAAWVGPKGADQDFTFPSLAWEVKTIPPDRPLIQIASERQLYSAKREVRLVVITLQEGCIAGSTSLNEMVDSARSAVGVNVDALDLLEDRLKEARYVGRREYDEPKFTVTGTTAYRVEAGFPRLLPSDLPVGVCSVSYMIVLANCAPFIADISI